MEKIKIPTTASGGVFLMFNAPLVVVRKNQPNRPKGRGIKQIKFAARVYSLCQKIPKGKVTTYKIIAERLGMKSYRAVGQALRCSPGMPAVPCHRVVASDGSLGGFKGKRTGKEVEEKRALLEKEGVKIIDNTVNLERYFYRF